MKTYLKIAILSSMIFFISCVKHEKRETKFDNGNLKEQFFVKKTKDGSFIPDGDYKTWFRNGQNQTLGQVKNGKKAGNWKRWYENGQLETDKNYMLDSLNGPYNEWHDNGQKAIEGYYKMDKKVENWSFWYENGQIRLKSTFSVNGEKNGLQVSWYENGFKNSEENYVNGEKNGKSTYWNNSGKIILERVFKDGKDINLPAGYKNKGGEYLVLNSDETYKLTYIIKGYFSNDWETKTGGFVINNGELYLIGIGKYILRKFDADTILLDENKTFIRVN